MEKQPTLSDWLHILALGIIWGGTFMVVRIALDGFSAITVATARTTLGAVALLLATFIFRRKIPWGDWNLWKFIIPIGLLSSALPFLLLSWGQQYVPSAFAGLSMAALPLFVLPLAHVFSNELLSKRKLFGVILGFFGAAILLGPGIFNFGGGDYQALARVACLGAAFAYAVSSVATRQCPAVDPIVLAALTLVVGSVVLLPIMLVVDGLPGWPGTRSGYAIIFLGLIPTALAALLRVSVIRSAGSVFTTLVNYQVPVFSMIFGAVILNEELPWRFFIALALILLGVAVSQWNALKPLLSRKKA